MNKLFDVIFTLPTLVDKLPKEIPKPIRAIIFLLSIILTIPIFLLLGLPAIFIELYKDFN